MVCPASIVTLVYAIKQGVIATDMLKVSTIDEALGNTDSKAIDHNVFQGHVEAIRYSQAGSCEQSCLI